MSKRKYPPGPEMEAIGKLMDKCDALKIENERLRGALEKIETWARAYPLDVFPEPDFTKAHEALKANGMTLDAISASAIRHVIDGIKHIVRVALAEQPEGGE